MKTSESNSKERKARKGQVEKRTEGHERRNKKAQAKQTIFEEDGRAVFTASTCHEYGQLAG